MPFNNGFSGFPGSLFAIIPIFVFCGFAFVFIMIIFTIFKGISGWSHNNNQPILIVPAKLISKRIDVSSHMHNDVNDIHHNNVGHSTTTYYITFEVESGSRMEFVIVGEAYGMMAEGDQGKLKFQGTRYLGFERT